VNNELQGKWKEAIVACCKITFKYLPEGTKEDIKSLSLDSQHPGQVSDSQSPRYESGVLITEL